MTDMTTNANGKENGWNGLLRSRMRKTGDILGKRWFYIGLAIFLATMSLLIGILTLSYLHPKKDMPLFAIVCTSIVLALSHFASLCYLIQRAKDESSEPTLLDAAYSAGVVVLFSISGTILTVKLKGRCFSGHNDLFNAIGQGCCNGVTAMAAFSWLGVLSMIIASIIILVGAKRAIEQAKLPPPVLPTGAETPVMRWLDRNGDSFASMPGRRIHFV